MKPSSPFSLLALSALTLPLSSALAIEAVWTSNATGGADWSLADNWLGDIAVMPGDSVRFPAPVAGGTRTVNNDLAANTLISGLTFGGAAYILNGNAINLGGTVNNGAGNPTTINLSLALQQATDFSLGAGTRIDMNGDISGAFGINKTGAGTLRLQSTGKTYNGDTIVSVGTLDLNVANALPSGTGKGNVSVAGGAFLTPRFGLAINGLNGSGTVQAASSGTKVITLGNNDANGDFGGTINNGVGIVAITKVGSGRQTLGGINGYTGATTINGGTLVLGASASLAGSVTTIGAAGQLAGSGTIAGPVTASGIIAPGLSAGTLTINNNLILGGSATLSYELNGTNQAVGAGVNDLLAGIVNLTLDGALNVAELGSFGGLSSGSWRLINYTGTLTDNGLTIGTMPNTDPGTSFTIDTATAGQVNLMLVPEPGTALLGLLAGLGLLRRRRV